MRKIKKCLLILLICMVIFVPFMKPTADSGFDGGYDGGGSSSSDFSGGSSGGGYSGSNITKEDMIITEIVFMVATIAFTINLSIYIKKSSSYKMDKLREKIPNYDEKEFKEKAYELYKNVQVAWMNFDYDSMQKYVTDEMYHMYFAQMNTLKMKKQKNIMKDFKLLDFDIFDMEINDKIVSLKVNMVIKCRDYIIDNDGKVIRGNNRKRVTYNYLMTFNKGMSDKPNKCPNCNAHLDDVNSSTCPYCDSHIINESYDWVLAKKQVLSQTVNHK